MTCIWFPAPHAPTPIVPPIRSTYSLYPAVIALEIHNTELSVAQKTIHPTFTPSTTLTFDFGKEFLQVFPPIWWVFLHSLFDNSVELHFVCSFLTDNICKFSVKPKVELNQMG